MKSKNIDTATFINDYCQTLEQDKNGRFFLKIPIENYEELSLLRAAMLNAVEFTAELHELKAKDNLPLTIHYLTHILQQIDFFTECQGLTALIEGD